MFTLLMAVYAKDSPIDLRVALASLQSQTHPLEEIVLVKDGPLTPALDEVVEAFRRQLPLIVLELDAHRGLAYALNEGMKLASRPWIMRFDSDDYCLPNRVKEQSRIAMLDDIDIFGSQIEEFERDHQSPLRVRSVPCHHNEIIRFALRRCPFNHMTVCFRRDLVLSFGGYPLDFAMQDYALWVRLLSAGVRSANSPMTLVRARVGNGLMRRRSGLTYAKSEWQLQRLMVELGSKTRLSAARDGIMRSVIFLAPQRVRALAYNTVLRKRASKVADRAVN
jgi:glycosyltransferase involved in cell wall biosynthesis